MTNELISTNEGKKPIQQLARSYRSICVPAFEWRFILTMLINFESSSRTSKVPINESRLLRSQSIDGNELTTDGGGLRHTRFCLSICLFVRHACDANRLSSELLVSSDAVWLLGPSRPTTNPAATLAKTRFKIQATAATCKQGSLIHTHRHAASEYLLMRQALGSQHLLLSDCETSHLIRRCDRLGEARGLWSCTTTRHGIWT